MAKAAMIAQLIKKNIQTGDAKDWPCATLCLKVCLGGCIIK